MQKFCSNLHGGKDKKDGQIDLNDQVNVLLRKGPCSKTDYEEKHGWAKHSQECADDWPAQSDLNNYDFHFEFIVSAHLNPAQCVTVKSYFRVMLQ